MAFLSRFFRSPAKDVRDIADEVLMSVRDPVVETVEDFRALPPRDRAQRSISALKMIGRFTVGMAARELDDHEIVAAILIGNGEIKREPDTLQSGETVTLDGKKFIVK